MKSEFSVAVDDGVTSVVAAGVADHVLAVLSQKIDYFPFSLVAPLSTDDGVCRHEVPLT